MCRWRYSGDCDLLLINGYYDASVRRGRLDFTSAIVCHLDAMKEKQAISSVSCFFESIFQYAERADGDDPAWGFSDNQGTQRAGSALRRLVLSLLPKELGKDAERVAYFAVTDISLPPPNRSILSWLGLNPK